MRGGLACEAGVSIEPGVERGFATETPGMRAEILCPLRAGERTCQAPAESSIELPRQSRKFILLDLKHPPTAVGGIQDLSKPLLQLPRY